MIDLTEPAVSSHGHAYSLFEVSATIGNDKAIEIALQLQKERLNSSDERTYGHSLIDLDALERQLAVICDPAFSRKTILWRRFAASEQVSLNELIGEVFGMDDPTYVEEILIPELLADGRANNGDITEPDAWQDYIVDDQTSFELQVKLFTDPVKPVFATPSLLAFAKDYLETMESPYEVDRDSEEFRCWLEGNAERLSAHLGRAVEGFASQDVDPMPEKDS